MIAYSVSPHIVFTWAWLLYLGEIITYNVETYEYKMRLMQINTNKVFNCFEIISIKAFVVHSQVSLFQYNDINVL